MPRPIAVGPAVPDWLVDEPFEDVPAGVLKSGKEAEVFLVERRYAATVRLLAHKRFRPRRSKPGELRALGFSSRTTYRHSAVYRAGWNLDSRTKRAVETGSVHGQRVVAAAWPLNEAEMLERAWRAGVAVPYPVDRTGDGVLMEFIGDRTQAAPRLVHAGLDGGALQSARAQLLENVARLTAVQIVHADLSVYNLLWWKGRLVLIDFPQAVDATTNPAAPDLLHRDLANVAGWFARHGAPIDVEEEFATLITHLTF